MCLPVSQSVRDTHSLKSLDGNPVIITLYSCLHFLHPLYFCNLCPCMCLCVSPTSAHSISSLSISDCLTRMLLSVFSLLFMVSILFLSYSHLFLCFPFSEIFTSSIFLLFLVPESYSCHRLLPVPLLDCLCLLCSFLSVPAMSLSDSSTQTH